MNLRSPVARIGSLQILMGLKRIGGPPLKEIRQSVIHKQREAQSSLLSPRLLFNQGWQVGRMMSN